ncbi:mitogen-activated protein kinase 4-like [Silene latifolia]|uniref:mitogen-activated protein kinase 4-like n=1 Tax=Silene latifolia TaxID=37657 RepID=UPI003D78A8BF
MMMMMQQHRNNVGVINNNFRNTHTNNGWHKFFKVWDTVFQVEAKYEPKDPIGRGAYGVVCSCMNTLTKEKVAIKKINVLDNSVEALKALRELKILRHVRHKNIIALKDVMIPSAKCEDVYLVFELMDADLGTQIRPSLRLPNNTIKYLMFQLLNGLDYLHSSNIIHRDLKPGNLLVNAKWDLKICDFGLATTTKGSPQTQPATEYVVTRWYRAPELLLQCHTYGPAIDIWSVGCIFAELLGGNPLFPGKNQVDQLMKIICILGTQNNSNLGFLTSWEALNLLKSWPYTPGITFESLFPYADQEGLDLLNKMLEFDPRKRITAAEALQHPYMRSMYYSLTSQPIPYPCTVDVDADAGVDKIRKMIWDEMFLYHIEAAFR